MSIRSSGENLAARHAEKDMDTPIDIARDKFFAENRETCVTCKYYRYRRTYRNGKMHELQWCDNRDTDNYAQLIEDITECNSWEEK